MQIRTFLWKNASKPCPFGAELSALLHGEAPRAYGEMPRELGLYERIAPGPAWDRARRGAGMANAGETAAQPAARGSRR